MASSKPKLAYRTDQRELSILIYASSRGGTEGRVFWRECQAGEDRKREASLLRWRWPGTINSRGEALACLKRIVQLLEDQDEPME
jgi:hypothetical protein